MKIHAAFGAVLLLGCSSPADDAGGAAGSNGSGGTSSNSTGGSSAGGAVGSGGATSGGASLGGSGGAPGAGTSSTGGSSAGSSSGGTSTGGSSTGGPAINDCEATPSAAPASSWVNATGNLAGMSAGCGNLSRVVSKPCSNTVLAAIADHGVWSTSDAGSSWTALGTGGGSAAITNMPLFILFDPADSSHFWENGLFGSAGLYVTGDAGDTFQQLSGTLMTQLVSVDFSDPERKTLVFGTHGAKQQIYLSTDAGVSFNNIGSSFPADAHNAESPLVLDSQTYLLGACGTSGDGVCGIYRTTNSGGAWTMASDLKVSHYGAPLWASDGNIYWPMLFDAGLAKSTDQGQTWTQVVGDTVLGITPIELPDASLATLGKDHLQRSTDGGVTWGSIGDTLPFNLFGDGGSLTYSALTKTFFYSHNDCGNVVLSDAVMSAGYDYE